MDWYRIDLNPVPWKVGPLSVKRAGKKMIPVMGQNPELAAYREAVHHEMEQYDTKILEGPLQVVFLFWRQMSEYTNYQQRTARNQEADATNLQKALEDALHGIFYTNDKDNHIVTSVIVRQDSEVEPKILVGVEEITLDVKFKWTDLVPDDILNRPKVAPADLTEEDRRWLDAKTRDDF